MGDQFSGTDLGPGLQLDKGNRRLAPLLVRSRHHRTGQHRRVTVQGILDLERADIFAAADDDVLAAILDLHIAVGLGDGEVTGVEPAAVEGLRGGGGILQVTLHHDVAAKHDFAHRLAIRRVSAASSAGP